MEAKTVNEGGRRVGMSHPRAVLTDRDVDLVHELRESGLTLSQIAMRMECSKSCIAHVVAGRRRAQTPVAWVRPGTSLTTSRGGTSTAAVLAVADDVGARLQAFINAAMR
ncbi:hypothetical protein dqs_1798 [Azoarcus olearius]|nr:hypothetical protein dqs_1798 [Azoarcus olearius]